MSAGNSKDAVSGSSTPTSRFTSQATTGEEALKSNTVGLVTLSDFRKRRAEALEAGDSGISRSSTPTGDDTAVKFTKKKRKAPKKGGVSFDADDDDVDGNSPVTAASSRALTPSDTIPSRSSTPRLAANSAVSFTAKPQTKSALAREAALKDSLRREFLTEQARVRATPFVLRFVFFDGADAPGGMCRMTKGEQVWRFLDRARKVGAESVGRRGWARVSVDDLMLVVDDLIIPHHYEFYFFMLNKSHGFTRQLFAHAATPTAATPATVTADNEASTQGGLTLPGEKRTKAVPERDSDAAPDEKVEGYGDDPALAQVVDRRWYERNKHVFPMSSWQDFDPDKDYASGLRRDAQGNAYFSLK
ncbi:hypothetical protein ANO11243_030220 [Dothideomycetidae sp. 11243]|nr:hypothetical protein ANO11243_030220 [fungal sp. No.11243]